MSWLTKNDDALILDNLVFISVWRDWNRENNIKNNWLITNIIWNFICSFSYFNNNTFKNNWRNFDIIVIFLCCLASLYCMFCKNQQREFCVNLSAHYWKIFLISLLLLMTCQRCDIHVSCAWDLRTLKSVKFWSWFFS